MLTFIIALILLACTLYGIALRKTYDFLPAKELKRQARQGDKVARVLYRAVAYGASLRLLLWLFIGITAAAGFVLFARVTPPLLAFVAVAGLLWYGFAWMPSGQVSTIGAKLVVWTTPAIARLLSYLHPVFSRAHGLMQSRRPVLFHTGLYEREDLIELIELQRAVPGNRISDEELDVVVHALSFGELTVEQVMVPRRVVVMASSSDVIGPILMDELHDSGHSRFPVHIDGDKDKIVGTLYLHDLVEAKHGGSVKDVARRSVYYAHEDQTLYQLLHAFLKTKHHLFIVVNSFEEYVGIITIEDVIEQIIGHKIEDEFDKYDDLRAVAAVMAKSEHAAHKLVPQKDEKMVE